MGRDNGSTDPVNSAPDRESNPPETKTVPHLIVFGAFLIVGLAASCALM